MWQGACANRSHGLIAGIRQIVRELKNQTQKACHHNEVYQAQKHYEAAMNNQDARLAVKALWLQYKGLTIESAGTSFRIENAAWQIPQPATPDPQVIDGLVIAN
jgi:hypothetical protein